MLRMRTRNYSVGMGLKTSILALLLSACQTAQIPNVQFIGSLGPSGAVTFDLLDAKTSTMTLTQFAAYWNDLANPKGPPVCMRSADWAQLKIAIEELCSWVQGGCNTQQQAALTNFSNQLKNVR